MADGSLSQDEIDALLKDTDDFLPPSGGGGSFSPGAGPSRGAGLSPVERDVLGETMSTVMGSVAPSLSGYLQKDISISNAFVEIKNPASAAPEFPESYVRITMPYSGGLNGQNMIIVLKRDAITLAELMFGQDAGTAGDLNEAQLDSLKEFFSTLLSAVATQLSARIGAPVNTMPATIQIANNAGQLMFPQGDFVKITYSINVAGIMSSRIFHVMDLALAVSIAKAQGESGGRSSYSQPQQAQSMQQANVAINPVKFPPLTGTGVPEVPSNIELIMDVQLTLTVELGRTTALVKDILGYGEGSIIELDKLAGEPVDLLVNGKLIAKGEVVVIDENFGVRVTDIVSPSERLTKMNNQ